MRLSAPALYLSAFVLVLAVACPSLAAQSTSEFFEARILPRDRSVALQLNSDKKTVEWKITPEGTPVTFKKSELLLTYSSFKVGFLHYNPLTVRLSTSFKDFDDPAQLALQKLIDGLTTVASTVSGTKKDLAIEQDNNLKALRKTSSQYTSKTENFSSLLKKFNAFGKQATDKKDSGKTNGIASATSKQDLDELKEQLAELQDEVAALKAAQDKIKADQEAIDPILNVIAGDNGAEAKLKGIRTDILSWPHIIDTAWGVSGTTGPAALEQGVRAMRLGAIELTKLADQLGDAFKVSQKTEFKTGTEIRLLNRLDTLIAQVRSSQKTITELIAVFATEQNPVRWTSPNMTLYVVDPEIDPTLTTGKEVSVTVTPLTLSSPDDGLKLSQEPSVTATFRARRYRALLPEVGVGAVMGYIDRPTYGTSLDANGKTVVALSETDRVSVDPAIMVNFICHCNAGGIAPMLQVGAATSKDLPAILLGGGFRLFGLGKGDIGIGGGLLLGWYKDLQKLKVGSPVGGTADIDADMGYVTTPKAAPYITLQYKF